MVTFLCAALLFSGHGAWQGAATSDAEQRFQEAEPLFQEYIQYRIVRDPEERLEHTVKEKLLRLQRAYRAFEAVLETVPRSEWTVAALVRMAEVLIHWLEILESLPPPEGFSPEEWDEYRPSLREISYTFEMKATALLEAAIELVHDLDLYGAWADRAVALLRGLKPDVYDPLRPLPVTIDHMSLQLPLRGAP